MKQLTVKTSIIGMASMFILTSCASATAPAGDGMPESTESQINFSHEDERGPVDPDSFEPELPEEAERICADVIDDLDSAEGRAQCLTDHFWTDERLGEAIVDFYRSESYEDPSEVGWLQSLLGADSQFEDAIEGAEPTTSEMTGLLVSSSAGRASDENPLGVQVCSASAAQTDTGESLVATSAHCVDDALDGGHHQGIIFIPSYSNEGDHPHGMFTVTEVFMNSEWSENARPISRGGDEIAKPIVRANDVAFGVASESSLGGSLYEHVGGHETRFTQPLAWTRTDVLGMQEINGEERHLFSCWNTTEVESYEDPEGGWWLNHRMDDCGLYPGASGGPWLSGMVIEGTGDLISVSQRGGEGMVWGPMFDERIGDLFDEAVDVL